MKNDNYLFESPDRTIKRLRERINDFDHRIDEQNSQKPEYIIIGSNNFWYASGLTSLTEAENEIKKIKKNGKNSTYSDPETGEIKEDLPEKFYIYKGIEIKQIYN